MLDNTELSGYFYNVEARWYLKNCEGTPTMEGFFIGPYFKHNGLTLDFDMTYDDGLNVEENTGVSKISEYGIECSFIL